MFKLSKMACAITSTDQCMANHAYKDILKVEINSELADLDNFED